MPKIVVQTSVSGQNVEVRIFRLQIVLLPKCMNVWSGHPEQRRYRSTYELYTMFCQISCGYNPGPRIFYSIRSLYYSVAIWENLDPTITNSWKLNRFAYWCVLHRVEQNFIFSLFFCQGSATAQIDLTYDSLIPARNWYQWQLVLPQEENYAIHVRDFLIETFQGFHKTLKIQTISLPGLPDDNTNNALFKKRVNKKRKNYY